MIEGWVFKNKKGQVIGVCAHFIKAMAEKMLSAESLKDHSLAKVNILTADQLRERDEQMMKEGFEAAGISMYLYMSGKEEVKGEVELALLDVIKTKFDTYLKSLEEEK